MAYILSILGALLVLEGIPYFAFPRKAKEWALLMQEVPPKTLRIIGAVSMAAGIILLYIMRFI
ncbi:MAG: DUF2065 domain-containing protein [Deltaproteobacteria bacterium]|nr:DUF2065 domain-containing protein [Deltaproteobacteria bacterium]MBI5809939.1 DUF2065 domain-containing protein [Deltaproteobacteria bacterium]